MRKKKIPWQDVEEKKVFSKGCQPKKVKARSFLCYWAASEAGISLRTLAKRLRLSAPGVGYAVERGEAIVQESHYELIEAPCSKLQGIFDRKECGLLWIRSLPPPPAAGNALAFAVQ
jgi:hypothetical protein